MPDDRISTLGPVDNICPCPWQPHCIEHSHHRLTPLTKWLCFIHEHEETALEKNKELDKKASRGQMAIKGTMSKPDVGPGTMRDALKGRDVPGKPEQEKKA